MNRVQRLIPQATKGPVSNMRLLLNSLSPSTIIPEVDKYYVFVYKAKTPNIQYDQNPLVAVGNVFQWGFRGMNFHWGEYRQYTWSEIVGGLYEVQPEEFQDLVTIPYGNIRLNS